MIRRNARQNRSRAREGLLRVILRAEKLAKRHFDEGRTRNALVKGEGVVCLHYPLPLKMGVSGPVGGDVLLYFVQPAGAALRHRTDLRLVHLHLVPLQLKFS